MWISNEWQDFEILDASAGERLERWGKYILVRPDPQVIWDTEKKHPGWKKPNGVYHRSAKGGGEWEIFKLPEEWSISYKELSFRLKPFSFKHTGLFPEQATNWDWIGGIVRDRIAHDTEIKRGNPKQATNRDDGAAAQERSGGASNKYRDAAAQDSTGGASNKYRDAAAQDSTGGANSNNAAAPRILNLFAYTGGATLAASAAGAEVTHLDASKGMVTWARENAEGSGLGERPIRWLVDDCVKFVERELRRGKRYDGIIMDPPSYGRGPKGEIWKMEEQIYDLLKKCAGLLSEEPLLFLLNAYSTGIQPGVLQYILESALPKTGHRKVEAGELGLPVASTSLILPCGISGRVTF